MHGGGDVSNHISVNATAVGIEFKPVAAVVLFGITAVVGVWGLPTM